MNTIPRYNIELSTDVIFGLSGLSKYATFIQILIYGELSPKKTSSILLTNNNILICEKFFK
jgi:hypothetical protein